MKNNGEILKYLILLAFAWLFGKLMWPFVAAIVFAALFAVTLNPLYKWFVKKRKYSKSFSSILVVVLTFIFIVAPFVLFAGLVVKEAVTFVNSFDQQTALELIKNYEQFSIFGYEINLAEFQDQIQELLKKAGEQFLAIGSEIAANIAHFTVHFFIFLFLYFYFLRDGDLLVKKMKKLSPFTSKQDDLLSKNFHRVSRTVFIGSLGSAVVSGAVAYVGLWIFGVNGALIWSLLAGLLSLIPTIGTFIVYAIVAIIVYFNSGWVVLIGFMAYFVLAEVLFVQNFVKGKMLDDKISAHPILVFLALVGGVEAFQSIGIVYGPLIMVTFVSLINFVVETKKV